MYKRFDDSWLADVKEQRRLELLQTSFGRKIGILSYFGNIRVSCSATTNLLQLAHDKRLAGHFGFKKTLGHLEKNTESTKVGIKDSTAMVS